MNTTLVYEVFMDKNGLEGSIYCGGEKILERECIKVGVSEN